MDKKKITNMEVKKKNRNEVFRYICKHGTVSNPDISYNMKISLPTATQITKELIAEGLLEEKGELESTGGRRAKALSAVVNGRLAVGLDITKNHIALVLTNIVGENMSASISHMLPKRLIIKQSVKGWNFFWMKAALTGAEF